MAAAPHYRAPGKRTYVLDTNVLLHDPEALGLFQEHDLVLPITVIEEVDKFKRELTELGRNARLVSRRLDAMRANGRLADGVPLPGGGTLRVAIPRVDEGMSLFGGAAATNDNIILATALRIQAQSPERVVFVSRDVNMRLKADALGMVAEDYEHAHVASDEAYTGVTERDVASELVAEAYAKGGLGEDALGSLAREFNPHQFVVLRNAIDAGRAALTRWDATDRRLVLVTRNKEGAWGLLPRNREQVFALDLLLDDSIPLVTLDGMAGTGKTLLAIAAGLKRVADDRRYRRLVVARPIFPPWMKPIFDNLELLLGGEEAKEGTGHARPGTGKSHAPAWQTLLDQGILDVEPLTYIRGRSIPRQYIVVDEAQNLTPHEVKTVITRAGEGTKIVLTGDRYQIDNPYVDATSNGLSYVIERFRESALAGHVTLRKGERSALAEHAAGLL